jgi:protein-tyrosine phosphatase
VGAERLVRFESVSNFRDLGGYPTLQGTCVRWGRVFRSDGLHQMTDADLSVFASIGVRTEYDLRSDAERSQRSDPVKSIAIEVVHPVQVKRRSIWAT